MTTTTALATQIRRNAGLRGNCGTCNDPVTHNGERWVHDHADVRCMGHQHDKPWAFTCRSIGCEFPHEVWGVRDVTR